MSAIARKKPSVPMTWLADNGFIPDFKNRDDIIGLDYGCGEGYCGLAYGLSLWDKKFEELNMPAPFEHGQLYDVITCIYVLNVQNSIKKVEDIVWDVQTLLKPEGVAYFAVRKDIKNLTGKNSRGFQCDVTIKKSEVIRETSTYAIYKVTKKCRPNIMMKIH